MTALLHLLTVTALLSSALAVSVLQRSGGERKTRASKARSEEFLKAEEELEAAIADGDISRHEAEEELEDFNARDSRDNDEEDAISILEKSLELETERRIENHEYEKENKHPQKQKTKPNEEWASESREAEDPNKANNLNSKAAKELEELLSEQESDQKTYTKGEEQLKPPKVAPDNEERSEGREGNGEDEKETNDNLMQKAKDELDEMLGAI